MITEHMPSVRSVSLGLWVGTGSREETPQQSGISHFIEHMVFKGTNRRSAEQIAREMDSLGGGLDAFTSKEIVSFNVKVLDEHLPPAFDIVCDMVRNPLFANEEIEKEKGVILEELKMEVDNPEYQIHEMFARRFWKGHALGQSILGTRHTIRSFDRAAISRYYRSFYRPSNLLVTAAGSLRHHELAEMTAQHLGDLKPRAFRPKPSIPTPHAPLLVRDRPNLEQVHVYVGVPAIPMSHKDRFAFYVLNNILGGGMSSRLFQNIRERLGLAYAVYSELSLYRDAGCMLIYAGTASKWAKKVIHLIVAELDRIASERVDEDELQRSKDHLKGSIVLGLESTSSRMANLARQETYLTQFMSLDEMIERVEAVTADQVQSLAQQFFDPKSTAVAMLGPLGGIKLTRRDVRAN